MVVVAFGSETNPDELILCNPPSDHHPSGAGFRSLEAGNARRVVSSWVSSILKLGGDVSMGV